MSQGLDEILLSLKEDESVNFKKLGQSLEICVRKGNGHLPPEDELGWWSESTQTIDIHLDDRTVSCELLEMIQGVRNHFARNEI